jgi:membrane-associated phospholipid phosphatase
MSIQQTATVSVVTRVSNPCELPARIESPCYERREYFARQLFWAIALSIYFFAIYSSSNAYAAHRYASGQNVHTFYFEWEKSIRFVPAFIVPYMSIDLFFFFAPFLCTDLRELRTHARRVVLAITVAGLFFVLAPLRYGFDRPVPTGLFGPIFRFLHGFDHPYNLAPSLHIALRSLLWVIYVRHIGSWLLRNSVRVWFLLIGLSTLLVGQHHVIDLASGQILAMFCFYLFPDAIAPLEKQMTRDERAPKNVFVAAMYALGLIACVTVGLFMRRWGWIMIWPAFDLAIVCLAYLGFGSSIFRKSRGRLPITTRCLLGPLLLGANISWFLRRSKPAFCEIAPVVWFGRRLSSREARQLVRDGFTAALDLTAEFSAPAALLELSYLNIPILDLAAPPVGPLQRAVQFIQQESHRGKVYVYCALGYSRSACVIAAYLLASRRAESVNEAITLVRRARPRIVINHMHRDVLRRFVERQTAVE